MKIAKILLTITSIIFFVALTSYTIFSNIELNKQIIELSNKNAEQNTQQNQKNVETADELQEHNDDIIALQKDLANAEVDIISLQKYIDTTENSIRDIKSEIIDNIKNSSNLENIHHSVQEEKIENLQNEIQELKNKITELEQNQKETKEVILTIDNIYEYIGYNITFANFNETKVNNNSTSTLYTCDIIIEIYPIKPNVKFNKVNFGIALKTVSTSDNTLTGCGTPIIGKKDEWQTWKIHDEQRYQHIMLPENGEITTHTQIYHVRYNSYTHLPCILEQNGTGKEMLFLLNVSGSAIIEE